MNLIEWINGVTKLSKATMDTFQTNIKTAFDNILNGTSNIKYDNTASGLESQTVKEAIDELAEGTNASASDVTYDKTASGLTSENVQGAIDEIVSNTKSEVLWTNSSPTASFGAKTITLKTNTFKYFIIFYRDSNESANEWSQIVQAGKSFHLVKLNTYTPAGQGYISIQARRYCSTTQQSITFAENHGTNTYDPGTITVNNLENIPVRVVGTNL